LLEDIGLEDVASELQLFEDTQFELELFTTRLFDSRELVELSTVVCDPGFGCVSEHFAVVEFKLFPAKLFGVNVSELLFEEFEFRLVEFQVFDPFELIKLVDFKLLAWKTF